MKKTFDNRNKKYIIILVIIIFFITILSLLFYVSNFFRNNKTKEKYEIVKSTLVTQKQKLKPTSAPTPEPTPYVIKIKHVLKKGELLQEHTVYHSSNYNRDNNLRVAAKMLSDTVVFPGEEFSFFGVIGNPNAEKGFKEAGAIVNHQFATALGGGICEVATSLNTVVVNAGLKTNALRHSLKVGYLNSTDHEATVSYDGGIDLKFTNTLKYPIMIKQSVNGGNVTSKIFKVNTIEKVNFKNPITGEVTKSKFKIKKILAKNGNIKGNTKLLKNESYFLNPNDFLEKEKSKESNEKKRTEKIIKNLIKLGAKASIEIDRDINDENVTIKNTKTYPILIKILYNSKNVQVKILKLEKLD